MIGHVTSIARTTYGDYNGGRPTRASTNPFSIVSTLAYHFPCVMLLNTPSLFLASAIAGGTAYKPCPILGPVFEKPTSLGEADIFQAAVKNLTTTLNHASQTAQTRYGKIPIDATSFSIGVFDTDNSLFSYQYSSPALRNGTSGVKEVTADSVYRVSVPIVDSYQIVSDEINKLVPCRSVAGPN